MNEIVDINTLFGPMPSAASDLSVDELTALMQRHSVSACCTLSTVGLLLDHNAGNSATRAACSENRSLIPTATINPQSFFGGDGPHLRFKADGFRLVRFFPGAQGWDVDYASFVAAVKSLEPQKLPVIVDIDRSGVATRVVRAVADYAGEVILAGIEDRTLSEAIALMRDHAKVYVETSNLLATGAIKHLVGCVGADRILYGSGAPARPIASGLNVLKHSGLTDGELVQVLSGNAKKMLEM